ncbi:hypothetical protein Tco_1359871 [Tanacetum coccineum]
MRTTLTASFNTAKYAYRVSFGNGGIRDGSALKKGKDLLVDFTRNRLRAASFPLRLYISFNVRGDYRSTRALVFLGFSQIPSEVTLLSKVSATSASNIFSSLLFITISSMYALDSFQSMTGRVGNPGGIFYRADNAGFDPLNDFSSYRVTLLEG